MPHDVLIPTDALDTAMRIAAPIAAIHNAKVADQLGYLRAWERAIQNRIEELRGQIVGGHAEGDLFEASVGAPSVRSTIDRKRLEADIGEAGVAKYLKFSTCAGRLTVTAKRV